MYDQVVLCSLNNYHVPFVSFKPGYAYNTETFHPYFMY